MKRLSVFALSLIFTLGVWAQGYKQASDISYTTKTDAYAQERLKLDVYYPDRQQVGEANDAPVIVWFHGGGLEGGNKEIPSKLKEKGWVVDGVNYRLLPKVTVKETLDDAAEAVAWVFRNCIK